MRGLEDKSPKLFVDNWYTSPRLILSLYNIKVGAFGTIRSNRKYFPAELAVKASRVDRGFYDYRTSPPLLACAWKDKPIINFLSNMHNNMHVVAIL